MRKKTSLAAIAALATLAGSRCFAAEAAAPVSATLKYSRPAGIIEVTIINISGASICLGHESGAPTRLQLWKRGRLIPLPNAFEGRPPATCHNLGKGESWKFAFTLEPLAGTRVDPDRVCHTITWYQHAQGASTRRRFCARI